MFAFVESHADAQTFPELEVMEENSARLYPQDGLAAHVLGYVGEVTDPELDSSEFAKGINELMTRDLRS